MKKRKNFASSPDPGLCCRYEFWSTSYFFNSIIGKATFWYCISCYYRNKGKSSVIIIRGKVRLKAKRLEFFFLLWLVVVVDENDDDDDGVNVSWTDG